MKRALLILLIGCAHDPHQVLDAYAQALRAKDAERVWLLSDDAFRKAHDRGDVEAYLNAHPQEIERLIRALEDRRELSASVELSNGERLQLIEQDAGWRLSFGGVEPFGAETPEAALSTFFRAAGAARLDALRTVMPDEVKARYASDEVLSAHLSALKPRIESAEKEMRPIRPNMAQIEGDQAWIAYGSSKRVELVRQREKWRVVDLE